jgi:hypothetical protein
MPVERAMFQVSFVIARRRSDPWLCIRQWIASAFASLAVAMTFLPLSKVALMSQRMRSRGTAAPDLDGPVPVESV